MRAGPYINVEVSGLERGHLRPRVEVALAQHWDLVPRVPHRRGVVREEALLRGTPVQHLDCVPVPVLRA